jgi:hypothetical protein
VALHEEDRRQRQSSRSPDTRRRAAWARCSAAGGCRRFFRLWKTSDGGMHQKGRRTQLCCKSNEPKDICGLWECPLATRGRSRKTCGFSAGIGRLFCRDGYPLKGSRLYFCRCTVLFPRLVFPRMRDLAEPLHQLCLKEHLIWKNAESSPQGTRFGIFQGAAPDYAVQRSRGVTALPFREIAVSSYTNEIRGAARRQI